MSHIHLGFMETIETKASVETEGTSDYGSF